MLHCAKYLTSLVTYDFLKQLITWLSKICLTSLKALFWNFPLLFSHSKNIRMSTLITIIITYKLLIIIIIIITKSHNNYCSVGVMELSLFNLLILNDCFLCFLRACHMWLNRNHMFKREIWDKFTEFTFLKFCNLPSETSKLTSVCQFAP